MDTDRNVLYGVLALRAGLVDPDQLASAYDRWARQQKLPLAQVLLQPNGLRAEDNDHLEYLLNRHLLTHGGSARAALAALADANVRSAFMGVRDSELRDWLANVLPGGLWLEPGARTGRGWRNYALLGGLVLLGLLLLGGGVVFVGVTMSQERAMMMRESAVQAEMQARLEAEQTLAAVRLDREALDRALRAVAGPGDDPQAAQVREKFFRELLDVQQERWSRSPSDNSLLRAVAEAHEQLAEHYLKSRDLARAEETFRAAIVQYQTVSGQSPRTTRPYRDLSRCQARLGATLREAKKLPEAEQVLRAAYGDLQQAVARDSSGNWMNNQHELASLSYQLARILHEAGRLDEAEQQYTTAESHWQGVGRQSPVNVDHCLERAGCQVGWGNLMVTRNRLAEAEAAFREAIRLLQGLTVDKSRLAARQKELAAAYEGLAATLTAEGKDREAEAVRREARKQQEEPKEKP